MGDNAGDMDSESTSFAVHGSRAAQADELDVLEEMVETGRTVMTS